MSDTDQFSAPNQLKISLLGTPTVFLNGQAVEGFVSSKATALLFYLAATGQTYTRDALAGLLWGEQNESKARKNLRDVLSNLRRLLGDFLHISRQTVALVSSEAVSVDLWQFETAVHHLAATPLTPTAVASLRHAADLYQGDFLAGFYIAQAPDFDQWLASEQSRLQQLYLQLLHHLTDYLTQQGHTTQGIQYVNRLLTIEPWREEAHRQLMRLLVWSGQRTAAIAQYHSCRRLLWQELGVAPEAETEQLYGRIRDGDPLLPPTPLPVAAIPHNLPAQLTQFVGRQTDLADICQRLQHPTCRLFVLTGPGGVGKTRLALQVAAALLQAPATPNLFKDGIYLVKLAAVEQQEAYRPLNHTGNYNPIAAAIADALQLTLTDPEAPDSRVQNYLRQKEMLLIMDNFEQLTAVAPYLTHLLTVAPKLSLFVTSRSRLNVPGEQLYRLDGLPVPTTNTDQQTAAVQLFVQTAQAVDSTFQLTADQATAVADICRLVNGLPLAIELAASWVQLLSCQEILQELAQNIHFLQTSLSHVSPQHDNLWAVFTYSWKMLSPEQQQVLRQLSLFRAGFSRQAAETVAQANLVTLSSLVDHSFLRRTNQNQHSRFEMLEVIRLYAAEQLKDNGREQADAAARHAHYFMAYLQQHEQQLQGQAQQAALQAIGTEIENIRAAWRWAVQEQDQAALARGLMSLFDYYDMSSRFQEGRDAFARAATAVPPDSAQTCLLHGRLIARQGWFAFHTGDYPEATQLLARSVQLLRTVPAAQPDLIFSLNYLGAVQFHLGQAKQAQTCCQEALALSQQHHYLPGAGIALNILAQIAYRLADYEVAQQYGQQSLQIVTQLGNPWSQAFSLSNLAQVAFARQDYEEMRRLSQIILQIRENMGDKRGMAMCLEQLGHTAVAQQKYADAHTLYQRSQTLYHDIGNSRGMFSTLLALARLCQQEGKWQQAYLYYQEALQWGAQLENVPELPQLWPEMMRLLQQLHKENTAVALQGLLAQRPLSLPQITHLLKNA